MTTACVLVSSLFVCASHQTFLNFGMASLLNTALVLVFLSTVVQSQFVPAPTDLTTTTGYYDLPVRWKEVPEGICETTPGVKSFSGYVDIAEHEHIFFWFFEARNADPTDAPLTVWINGGPGSSSMVGNC